MQSYTEVLHTYMETLDTGRGQVFLARELIEADDSAHRYAEDVGLWARRPVCRSGGSPSVDPMDAGRLRTVDFVEADRWADDPASSANRRSRCGARA
jgi:hypothetical protein